MLFQTAEDAENAENLLYAISVTSVLSAVQNHKFCVLSILNKGPTGRNRLTQIRDCSDSSVLLTAPIFAHRKENELVEGRLSGETAMKSGR